MRGGGREGFVTYVNLRLPAPSLPIARPAHRVMSAKTPLSKKSKKLNLINSRLESRIVFGNL